MAGDAPRLVLLGMVLVVSACGLGVRAGAAERVARRAWPTGDGARRIRTADLLGAIQALSQLSYSPGKATV